MRKQALVSQSAPRRIWLEPQIELARNYRLSRGQLREVERLIEEHVDELVGAWREYFGT